MKENMKSIIVLFFLLMSFSHVSAVSNGTYVSVGSTDVYNPGSIEPDPWIQGTVSIYNYKETYEPNVFTYEDDGGFIVALPFVIDTNVTNPIMVAPDKFINASWTDPIEDGSTDLNWLDVNNWTITNAIVGASISTITEGGVKKLRVLSPGVTGVDSYIVNLDLSGVTVDVAKMRLIVGIDFVTIPGNANSQVSIILSDSAGNNVTYIGSPTVLGGDVVANTSGTVVFLDSLGGFTGPLTNLKITMYDADASVLDPSEIKIFALAVDKRQYSFGTDNNSNSVTNLTQSDGGYVKLDVFSPSFTYTSLETIGPISFKAPASKLAAKYTNVTEQDFTIGSYARKVYYNFSMNVPKGIDLTYGGLKLVDSLVVNSMQYNYVGVKGLVKTGLYSSFRVGDVVTLSNSLSEGTNYLMDMEVLYTEQQWNTISEPVGAVYGSPDTFWNRWWLWIATLLGVGFGVKRRRRN